MKSRTIVLSIIALALAGCTTSCQVTTSPNGATTKAVDPALAAAATQVGTELGKALIPLIIAETDRYVAKKLGTAQPASLTPEKP